MDHQWKEFLEIEKKKDYYEELKKFVQNERLSKTIYPEPSKVFNALKLTSYTDVKVVILGKEPQNTTLAANGLAFGTNANNVPVSLSTIFREIRDDVYPELATTRTDILNNTSLYSWARQGVLLWNTILTVEKGSPDSHKHKGWEELTISLIEFLNNYHYRIVYMLWGKNAQKYKQYIDEKHLVLETSFPGAHTAQQGFIGCKHFSKANKFITDNYFNKRSPITWAIV